MGACCVRQQGNASAVGRNIFLHDGQADTAAANAALGLTFAPVKGLKNPIAVCGRDAHALVLNVQLHPAGVLAQRQFDAAFER